MDQNFVSRRRFLQGAGGLALATSAPWVHAQGAPLKVGLMLPYTGTYAALGNAITNAFKLYVAEKGGKLAGRDIEYVVLDDESEPAKAVDNANRIVNRDKVDVLVGTVHSGVQQRGDGGGGALDHRAPSIMELAGMVLAGRRAQGVSVAVSARRRRRPGRSL